MFRNVVIAIVVILGLGYLFPDLSPRKLIGHSSESLDGAKKWVQKTAQKWAVDLEPEFDGQFRNEVAHNINGGNWDQLSFNQMVQIFEQAPVIEAEAARVHRNAQQSCLLPIIRRHQAKKMMRATILDNMVDRSDKAVLYIREIRADMYSACL